MKPINGKITITRPTLGSGREVVRIYMRDEASKQVFIDAEMSLEDFAKALLGQAHMPFTAEVKGLEHVGLTRVMENRTIEQPAIDWAHPFGWSREQLEQWLVDSCQETGWIVAPYLGSQGSRTHANGKTYLNYSVYKFVEPTDDQDS